MRNPDSNTSSNEMKMPFNGQARNPVAEAGLSEIRARWIEDALKAMDRDLADDHFSAAIGHFREALCLSNGFPDLKAVATAEAAQQSEKLLPRNWRIADALLQEAAATEPAFSPGTQLLDKLLLARYEELIARAIQQADRAVFDGKVEQARQRIKELLAEYPKEQKLNEALAVLDRPPAEQPAPETKFAVIKSDAPRNIGLYNDATPKDFSPTRMESAASTWDGMKNFVALATTTVLLGVAAFLLWQHFSTLPATAPSARKDHCQRHRATPRIYPGRPPLRNLHRRPWFLRLVLEPPAPPPDEQAWQLVKTSNNVDSIRSFVASYPSSAHVLRAKLRLAAVEWNKMDKTNVPLVADYLRLHPRSPYRAEAERLIADANAKAPPAGEAPALVPDRDAILEAVRVYRQSQPGAALDLTSAVLQEPVIEADQATRRLQHSGDESSASILPHQARRGMEGGKCPLVTCNRTQMCSPSARIPGSNRSIWSGEHCNSSR